MDICPSEEEEKGVILREWGWWWV